MPQNVSQTDSGRYTMPSLKSWPAERWAAIVVLGALGLLILIRMGFRGISVMGARVSVN